MGRTKQYERTKLLDRAVELFRNQGFNGTSTAELVDELGINRKSMYAEFGSKEELFEAAHLEEVAAFLTTLLIGVAASIRAEAPPEQLHATSRAVSNILDGHQPTTRR